RPGSQASRVHAGSREGLHPTGVIYLLSTILLICFNDFSEIQWVHEDRITLFTADGLVQIGGSITPRHVSSSDDAAQVMDQLVWEGLGLGGGTDVRNWGSLVYQAISIANNACWAIGELAVK
ncbi:hypothetical protein HN51_054882, partial [Arachis hypogaea]